MFGAKEEGESLSEEVIKSIRQYFRLSVFEECRQSQGTAVVDYNQPLPFIQPQGDIDFSSLSDLHNVFFFMKADNPKECLDSYFKSFSTNVVLYLANNNMQTLLHIATISKSLICVNFLLDSGANIQAKDNHGWTALHIACFNGTEAIIKELVRRGAPVLVLTQVLATPLHLLLQSNLEWNVMKPLLQIILEQGADINACDAQNGTPLYYACHTHKSRECVRFLLKNGATPNTLYKGETGCLHEAVAEKQIEIVTLLLEFNANPAIQIPTKGDALDIAKSIKSKELCTLLRQYIPEKLKTSATNPLLILRASQARLLRSPLGGSENSLEAFHHHLEEKKKALGIPDIPQYFIESFQCELQGIAGNLHIWQFHIAFEPNVASLSSKIIPITSIRGFKKAAPPAGTIEITKIDNSTVILSNFNYFLDVAFNILEFLHSMKDKEFSTEVNGRPFLQALGEIKFPIASEEMKERFGSMLEEGDSLVDFCNATMYSVGNVQIPLGKGRIYLIFRGLLFYAKHLSIDIRLFIPFDDIVMIETENDTGLVVKYTGANGKPQSRYFSLPSSSSCTRVYEWMDAEWKRALQSKEMGDANVVPVISIVGPRSQFIDQLIPLLGQEVDIRVILLDFKYNVDSFLIPCPLHSDAQFQYSTNVEVSVVAIHSSGALRTALQGTTTLIFIPPLPEMLTSCNALKRISCELKKLEYMICMFPYAPSNQQDIEEVFPTIISNCKQIFTENWNPSFSVSVIQLYPLIELFEIVTDCTKCYFYLPEGLERIHWCDFHSTAKLISQFIFQPDLRKVYCTVASTKTLTKEEITRGFLNVLEKQFDVHSNMESVLERLKTDVKHSFFELRCIEEFFTTINRMGAPIDKETHSDIVVEDMGNISVYLKREYEKYLGFMSFVMLSTKESSQLEQVYQNMLKEAGKQALAQKELDAPAFIDICGHFMKCSGLSSMLFHALMDPQSLMVHERSFVQGMNILLHGTTSERVQFLFKMYQSSSSYGNGFQRGDIMQIVSAIDVFFHVLKKNYNTDSPTTSDDKTLSIPLEIELIRDCLMREFDLIAQEYGSEQDEDSPAEEVLFLPLFEKFLERATGFIRSLGSEASGCSLQPLDESVRPGIPIVFGHSDWEQLWYIMVGLEASVHQTEEQINVTREKDSFGEVEYCFDHSSPSTSWILVDQAPCIFKRIRDFFGVSSAEYLDALGPKRLIGDLLVGRWTCYRELSSSGRSGSIFYSSWNGRFFLKTLPEEEEFFLRKNLASYYYYVTGNPNTLLTRFYGLLRIKKGAQGSWMNIVVMENLFSSSTLVQEIYDLKGSTVNRHVSLSVSQQEQPTIARKDNDFSRVLRVGSLAKAILLEIVEKDILWMESLNITDYSLLVGIHVLERKNREDVTLEEKVKARDLKALFKSCNGGILSEDRKEIYFLGLIDILGQYNLRKKGEYLVKSFIHSPKQISASPPGFYRKRFQKYVTSILK